MRRVGARSVVIGTLLAATASGCAARGGRPDRAVSSQTRLDAIRRAAVWAPTDVPAMDVRKGPGGPGAFPPEALVECVYVSREMAGSTPKFTCELSDGDKVKVKYGASNGEVYAEVAATRLLWALGFGADAMYPVRVRCRGCPASLLDSSRPPVNRDTAGRRVQDFDYAAIERKMPGREIVDRDGPGWSWPELRLTTHSVDRDAIAHRDALTLLAAVIQHTDSKREQQRLVCLDPGRRRREEGGGCEHPFMLISDLGKTFGKANAFNRDGPGSVNLEAWRSVSVWSDATSCRANLTKSVTGTLDNPRISDAGRRFLAGLLNQLTDRQLTDLFAVARFPERAEVRGRPPESTRTSEWVTAFKDKIRQVSERSCNSPREAQ
ncbi:MAG: hypothetical protein AB7N65_14890 [Vicinamibacterales bacterium]